MPYEVKSGITLGQADLLSNAMKLAQQGVSLVKAGSASTGSQPSQPPVTMTYAQAAARLGWADPSALAPVFTAIVGPGKRISNAPPDFTFEKLASTTFNARGMEAYLTPITAAEAASITGAFKQLGGGVGAQAAGDSILGMSPTTAALVGVGIIAAIGAGLYLKGR